ncbi:hypothetical protein KUV28_10450 [Ferrimonas balearica]|nr:hypothetical protein [Ferrimonas balearica]
MVLLMAGLTLGGCGSSSNPFDEEAEVTDPDDGSGDDASGGDGSDPQAPINEDLARPPGTDNPTPNSEIVRYEEMDGNGNGFALRPMYQADSDSFSIDNLAFDGPNNYSRDDSVPSLGPAGGQGPFYVYEAAETVVDEVNGKVIDQLEYKAIYALSTSGATEAVVVRTGSYEEYGFGGFIYRRNDGNSVVIPTTGQARFDGDYSALRDFNGREGLEYAVGRIRLDIDFEDFDGDYAQDAIKGGIYDRRIYDTSGNDLTQSIMDSLNADAEDTVYTSLPVISLNVGPNTIDANGEAVGSLGSERVVSGDAQEYLAGNYYAILSGENPDEITGVVVVEGGDSRFDGVTVRETGVFTADR